MTTAPLKVQLETGAVAKISYPSTMPRGITSFVAMVSAIVEWRYLFLSILCRRPHLPPSHIRIPHRILLSLWFCSRKDSGFSLCLLLSVGLDLGGCSASWMFWLCFEDGQSEGSVLFVCLILWSVWFLFLNFSVWFKL